MLMLNEQSLTRGLKVVTRRDQNLDKIYRELGTPPMWHRGPGFATLLYIILEQQVSLASAKASFNRLLSMATPLTPQKFLELDDAALRLAGFSRQKISYGRGLAEAVVNGSLDLESLGELGDDAVKAELVKIKGIGHWTADIYLLMALLRPDAWPRGDLGLVIAVQEIKRLPARPTPDEMDAIGRQWQPWRAVAARLLWHYYLNRSSVKQPLQN